MSDPTEKTWKGLVIDLSRALRDPDYRREISEDLEGDITELVMEEAADVLALQDALTAAKLHEAAHLFDEAIPYRDKDGRIQGAPTEESDTIRALIDTDHQAALDAYVRREVEKERERILAVVDSWHDDGNKPCDTIVMKIAAAIREAGHE